MKNTLITTGVIATLLAGGVVYDRAGKEDITEGKGDANTAITYAQIDKDGIVTNIIIADEAFIQSGAVGDPSAWVLTDYKTAEKAASIGGKYDDSAKSFIEKEAVLKYGKDVKATDVVKPVAEEFNATST